PHRRVVLSGRAAAGRQGPVRSILGHRADRGALGWRLGRLPAQREGGPRCPIADGRSRAARPWLEAGRLRDTDAHDHARSRRLVPVRSVMTDLPSVSRRRAVLWAIAIGLAAATFLLYAPVLRFGFIHYDDPHYVLLHPRISRGLSWDNLRWAI